MNYLSVIRNFANIGTEQAEKLRELLSLSMPVEMLKFCGSYYKNQIKRDPYVDEIKMLDMLVSAREKNGAFSVLTEFFTNDAFVARTYADLVKKRKQLYPNLARPITLREAANLASEYIHRARGTDKIPHFLPSIENVRDCISYPDANCVTTSHSALRLRMLPIARTEVTEGDVLILVSSSGNDVQAVFARKISALLGDKELMQYVKGVANVGRGGILQELLNMTDGVQVQLSALSTIGTSVPVTALCDGYMGSKILRVAHQYWSVVTTLLAKSGVRALPFATVKNDTKFVFVRDRKSSFVLDAHFLRTLNRYKPTAARLGNEATLPPDKIAFGGIGGGRCDYLAPETTEQIGEVVHLDGTACVAASSTPASTPYKTALWSVLAPIASLCACGVSYDKQLLSIALEIPDDLSDERTVGKCIAGVLGLYRAQTELALPTTGRVSIRGIADSIAPTLSVWSLAQSKKKMPATFTKSGSFVYAVAPKLDKDGLPDFAALRQLLNQLARFASEGKILSSRTLVGEAVTDGIRKMSLSHTCVLSDKRVAAEGKVPLCILIESEAELPFAYIGKVHPFIRLPRETVDIPARTELVACDRPEVVIVATLADSNAMALASLLENRGAHVSLFTEAEKNAVALSRAILTTQSLILCNRAKLPETKQIQFALDTLQRAGGILLSLSPTATVEGFVSLKNGINEEILQKIGS